MYTVIIPHYFDERIDNLNKIKEKLDGCNVLVWNNSHQDVLPAIKSPYNIGSKARFLTAMVAQTEYIVFQDNDVLVSKELIEKMIRYAGKNTIITLDGRILNDGYINSQRIFGGDIKVTTKADISLARCEVMHKDLFLKLFKDIDWEKAEMDDIWLSYSARKNNVPIYVMAFKEGFEELDEKEVGYSHRQDHYNKRDLLVKALFI